jgi:aminoglycoside phosphotransferase (APT) family kinase protein
MTIEPGPLLASGRDSDIFEFGPGKVLRRARDGRSLAFEATVMEYVRGQGYPVPAIRELRSDGTELVMDRIDGPHLLAVVGSQPWRLRAMARMLADLHARLHEIAPPPGIPELEPEGNSLLHLDLHPLNVIVSPSGPVVIDWPNVASGHGATDVADTWLVLRGAEMPDRTLKSRLIGRARALFVNAFLSRFDRDEVCAHLRVAAERRTRDRNLNDAERVAMHALVARYAPA